MEKISIDMSKQELDSIILKYYSEVLGLNGYELDQPEIGKLIYDVAILTKKVENGTSKVNVGLPDLSMILDYVLNPLNLQSNDLKLVIDKKEIKGIQFDVIKKENIKNR